MNGWMNEREINLDLVDVLWVGGFWFDLSVVIEDGMGWNRMG